MEKIEIRNNIKGVRKKAHLTQTQFGKLVGLSKNAVCSMEKQQYQPDVATIYRIMLEFDVSFFQLIFDADHFIDYDDMI